MRHPLLPATLTVAVAVALSCGQSLESLGEFPCAQNGECPTGWWCVAQTCVQIEGDGSTDGGTRACESDYQCGASKACTAVQGGGSTCDPGCSQPKDPACGSSQDCKLVLSGVKNSSVLVAACMVSGTKTEGTACSSANDCGKGLGCRDGRCRYFCSSTVACSGRTCTAWSGQSVPAGWGHCL